MAELFWLLRLSLSLALLSLLQGREDKPRVGNVNLNDSAPHELFSCAHDVLDGYVVAVHFNVDYIFKLDFTI